jgi:F0F1-type ATP synthase membrane subunit b/b'
MPQFLPFFFFNQLLFSLLALFVLVYLMSKFFLPSLLFSQVIKTYILKLSSGNSNNSKE